MNRRCTFLPSPFTSCPCALCVYDRFLGSSGQPLCDMSKYVGVEDRMQLLEKTLSWRHMAPTAPDTLGLAVVSTTLFVVVVVVF